MATERVPEPLTKRGGGGLVVERLLKAITLVLLIQFHKETFEIMCLNKKS